MLRICTLTAGFALGASLAHAQSAPTPVGTSIPAPSAAPVQTATPTPWTLTPTVVSQYMYRGVRLGGPAFQPTIEYAVSDKAVLGVFCSTPLANKTPGQSDPEIDPYGSYTFKVSDLASVQPGFYVYGYPRAKPTDGFYRATFEPNLAFNFGRDDAMLTAKFYYDVVAKGPTFELTATGKQTIGQSGLELDYSATAGTFIWRDAYADAQPPVKNWGNYYLASISAYYPLYYGKFGVGLTYTKGEDNFVKSGADPKTSNLAAVGRAVVSVSYGFSF